MASLTHHRHHDDDDDDFAAAADDDDIAAADDDDDDHGDQLCLQNPRFAHNQFVNSIESILNL